MNTIKLNFIIEFEGDDTPENQELIINDILYSIPNVIGNGEIFLGKITINIDK